VAVVHNQELFLAWHTWRTGGPGDTIVVAKVPMDQIAEGRLTLVREVPSLGTLVGFTVDDHGVDHVLSARLEELPNQPPANFSTEVHEAWRKNAVTMYNGGRNVNLNTSKWSALPFYGLTSGGSGRLASGNNMLAAVFARRRFTQGDQLIHQEGDALVIDQNQATAVIKADNTVSHSFDQRLIFDGTDFVALHQCDTYPCAGLIIQKLRMNPGGRSSIVQFPAYTCPTFGNSVYFELGGLAAEADGYPVLFTGTRNTADVSADNAGPMHQKAWDLAMVYVMRDFDTKAHPPNPYNLIGSGILAGGYAPPEEFKVTNFTWNPNTSRFDLGQRRDIRRRVLWVTEYPDTKMATNAKFVKLRAGQYVTVWEEHIRFGDRWAYATTRAMVLSGSKADANERSKSITRGAQVQLKDLRLHHGDDAVTLTIHSSPRAAWVTAGPTNRQLLVHTLDAELTHKSYPLTLP
jgi:hypothetical protein